MFHFCEDFHKFRRQIHQLNMAQPAMQGDGQGSGWPELSESNANPDIRMGDVGKTMVMGDNW